MVTARSSPASSPRRPTTASRSPGWPTAPRSCRCGSSTPAGTGDELTIARGIRYAVSHGAQVINLSLEFLPNEVTSASDIPEIVSARSTSRAPRGVMVVGAAGNDQDNADRLPGAVPRCHLGRRDHPRSLPGRLLQRRRHLDLVAPGGGGDAIVPTDPLCHPGRNLPSIYQLTLTTRPTRARFGYPGYYIGTSMSAPEVAATAALVIASGVIGRHPTPAQLLHAPREDGHAAGRRLAQPAYGYGIAQRRQRDLRATAQASLAAIAAGRRGQVVRTISTEQGAWWETLLGTEPSRKRVAPVIPLLPTTIRSERCSSATSMIASAASPTRAKVSTSLHPGRAGLAGGGLQQREHVLTRVDRPLHVVRARPARSLRSRPSGTGS